MKRQVEAKLEAISPTLPDAPGDEAPSYATAASTRAYLERMSKRVVDGRLAPSQAGAVAQFAGLAIKLAELQAERDLLDLELKAANGGSRPARQVRIAK